MGNLRSFINWYNLSKKKLSSRFLNLALVSTDEWLKKKMNPAFLLKISKAVILVSNRLFCTMFCCLGVLYITRADRLNSGSLPHCG